MSVRRDNRTVIKCEIAPAVAGVPLLSNYEQHILAGFEVCGESTHLLAAFRAQRIGDREVVAVLAQLFGDVARLERGHMAQHDGVDARAKLRTWAADHLDGVIGRKDEYRRIRSEENTSE